MPRPLEMLFRPFSSGTEATPGQRLSLLAALLDSPEPSRQHLGLAGLRIMLSVNWSGSVPETFGVRVRGAGWQPRSPEEFDSWYADVLAFVAERLALPTGQSMALVDLVSRALPQLVYSARIGVPLESLAVAQRGRPAARSLWQALAVALLRAPRHAREAAEEALIDMLQRLEASIRPVTLQDRIEALLVVSPHGPLDVLTQERLEQHRPGSPAAAGSHAQTLERLASELAARLHEPGVVAPWLVSLQSPHAGLLGEHLANAVVEWHAGWTLLKDGFRQADPQQRASGLLLGFFSVLHRHDGALAEAVLAEVAVDKALLEVAVELHAVHSVTQDGAERLITIARSGAVAAERFGNLMFGGVLDDLAPAAHARLLRAVAAMPDGVRVAIELQRMRLHGLNSRQAVVDDAARELCAELLLQVDAGFTTERDWYGVDDLLTPALGSPRGREVAARLCAVLIERSDGSVLEAAAEAVARQLFAGQPLVALDAFGPAEGDEETASDKDWWFLDDRQGHPVKQLDDEVLLDWSAIDADRRGTWLGARIGVFAADPAQGFSPLARALIEQAPDRRRILESFESGALPRSWAGSYSAVAQPFVTGLSALLADAEPDVVDWARAQLQRIEERVARWDRKERQRAQSFE